jgi:hypothetical protein
LEGNLDFRVDIRTALRLHGRSLGLFYFSVFIFPHFLEALIFAFFCVRGCSFAIGGGAVG